MSACAWNDKSITVKKYAIGYNRKTKSVKKKGYERLMCCVQRKKIPTHFACGACDDTLHKREYTMLTNEGKEDEKKSATNLKYLPFEFENQSFIAWAWQWSHFTLDYICSLIFGSVPCHPIAVSVYIHLPLSLNRSWSPVMKQHFHCETIFSQIFQNRIYATHDQLVTQIRRKKKPQHCRSTSWWNGSFELW